jgi:CheY-like chemotaxis protein
MPCTVLVVDDNENMRDVVSWCLRGEGYRVLTAADGAEALRRMAEHRVNVVILDLQMPVLDGTGVLAVMKATPRFRDTPVVMLTGDPTDAPRESPR